MDKDDSFCQQNKLPQPVVHLHGSYYCHTFTFKVRNRLDGNAYAIKRIVLNPKSKDLNKKITREVKLLSRLNHENVVR